MTHDLSGSTRCRICKHSTCQFNNNNVIVNFSCTFYVLNTITVIKTTVIKKNACEFQPHFSCPCASPRKFRINFQSENVKGKFCRMFWSAEVGKQDCKYKRELSSGADAR